MTEPTANTPNAAPNDVHSNSSAGRPELFASHGPVKESRNWTPLIVGFALVLVVVTAIAIFGRSKPQTAAGPDPYAANLVVEQAKLSQADNFVGATVTYIDLTVRNNGQRTVTGGLVKAIFRDTLGQAVQTETVPLRVLVKHALGGDDESAELAAAPLGPGQTRTLRLTMEHISSEWNQAQPELEFRGLQLK
jgi:hypothetical protein